MDRTRLDPGLVASQHDDPGGERFNLLERLRETGVARRAVHVDVEPVGPRRRALGTGLERHEVHAPHAERLERERQHSRLVIDQHDHRGLVADVAPARRGQLGPVGAGEGEEAGLVGGVVLDPLGERQESVGVGRVARRDGGDGGVPLLGHDLGAARRVPRAHQLDVGKMLGQPHPALPQRHRMGEDSLDPLQLRAGHRHQRVVHRVENLVGEPQQAVAESLFEEVVGGRDRAYERVLDRQAPGLRPALPDGGHHVLRLAAGKRLQPGPPATRSRLAEGPVGALNRNTHAYAPRMKNKKPRRGIRRGVGRSGRGARLRHRHRTAGAPRRRW